MNKLFLVITLFTLGNLFGQETQKISLTNDLIISNKETPLLKRGNYRTWAPETTVGGTTFDLQTNSSNQRRIINHADGTISLCWMLSYGANKNPDDRGTGYNFYNGNAWITNASVLEKRIESKKTGWPNILITSSGKEVIIAHNSKDTSLIMLSRSAKGNGAWTEQNILTPHKLLWSRAIVGGTDGNTIHVIASTLTIKNGGQKFKNVDGTLIYAKSTDGGSSWSVPDTLPGAGESFALNITGDSYNMDADGNNVAIVIGNSWSDVVLFKSTNNGNSWTKKVIYDFPINQFNEKVHIVQDTLASDGFTEILIDKTGKAHVWYGITKVSNKSTTDNTTTYNSGSNGLMYWSETELQPYILTQALDINGDKTINTAVTTGYVFPIYNCGLSSMPTAGIDASGTIYLVYSAFMENFTSSKNQNYRHLYAMKSSDQGINWSAPLDITPSETDKKREYVYPSLARKVDTYLHIVALEDAEPGLALSSENDDFDVFNIVYIKAGSILNSVEKTKVISDEFSVYPNPSSDRVNINLTVNKNYLSTVFIKNILGETLYSNNIALENGRNQFTLPTQNFNSGVYFIEIQTKDKKFTQQIIIQ